MCFQVDVHFMELSVTCLILYCGPKKKKKKTLCKIYNKIFLQTVKDASAADLFSVDS